MRRDTHGGGSCGDRGPFDSPHGGACPTTPQTASRMTAAHAAPPWPIKTQLSGQTLYQHWVTECDCEIAERERGSVCVRVCIRVYWGCSCVLAIIS